MNYKILKKADLSLFKSLEREVGRQKEGLEMIPSENYTSAAVLDAVGSILTNKYSEGYPYKRYHAGNEFIDEIEELAQERAKKLFNVPYVNVQPYSGSPANHAVYLAVLKPGDTVLGMNLYDGGHLTHGWKTSFSGLYYHSVPYHVNSEGVVDFSEVIRLVSEHKPKLIWVGGSAYTKEYEFEVFSKIADDVGAYLAADIAHVAGLVAGGAHKSPAPFVHIITSTTHITLRGPRGAMIMVTKKGLKKDPELGDKIDKAVFPGLQGGPHNHVIAGIAVCLKETSSEKFKKYAKQVVRNAKALARSLKKEGLKLVGGGTDNHLLLVDLTQTNGVGSGIFVQDALSISGITVNKNMIPMEPSSPFYPSGIRLGSPAITSRGMKEKEMEKIGKWVASVIREAEKYKLPEGKDERAAYLKKFRRDIAKNKNLLKIREEIKKLCKRFPVPGID
ncbi:hypothetical protein A2716_02245 [candidate division WWE3 bacterium RIFCSPHIGHO2_01_FULL_40_23]|uniref:Serine hydroxymethyltransferase n=1 Tax=candidate division WWE3 bacterium RIFCSPLOWO2_01_FULL_41_18 TaxID=1802625 RepID=A0A1F4VF45_UNCKA|nr:MAG: hypothetical protein A2716_02245 [candidate division WWE3 bacterium RIFCSPHIGHO2_01_FULL_40_23]OGC55807.1 MAG: hypothetical protein A3A78_02095 [candidate division WWE3 bacterium RIFCSPLOWO2_01_FULL_41_18]